MRITQTNVRGNAKWMLDLGQINGKRKRLFYNSEAEAIQAGKERQADVQQTGEIWVGLPGKDRVDLVAIVSEINKTGATLNEVWKFWQENHRAESNPAPAITLGQAVKQCILSRQKINCRQIYLDSLTHILGRFVRGREAELIPTDKQQIESWIDAQPGGPHWKSTLLSRLTTFYSYCVDQEWLSDNPCLRIPKFKIDHSEIILLTVDESRRLLSSARKRGPQMIPAIVLGLFAGLRPMEAEQIRWQDVDLDRKTVVVNAGVSKVRHRRISPLSDNAVEWLRLGGELPWETAHRTMYRGIKEAAGIRWTHDVLRHTAASYLLEQQQDAAKVALWLGNSPQILFSHYRNLVTKSDAEAFWKIIPENVDTDPKV